ncbi:MAG: CDP-diacylglycerol--glycerol-3-phosphate 3-phosphatidyltransferase [Acidobacteria bacterium]|nr:MAG: CDP-diacylglycerol--glycerol-3-phosphate 3-phosphatidyltransferase [Acidobacteriota bacterium]
MNIATYLTLFRIFLVPILVVVMLTRFEGKVWLGVGIFWLASITDFFDGYIARKRREVTSLGKLLDPVADKLLVSAAFISLVEMRLAPAWMVVIIVGREFAVSGLRQVALAYDIVIPASILGKFKMISQVIAISLLILGEEFHFLWVPGIVFLWIVLVLAIGSSIDYFMKFWRKTGDVLLIPQESDETGESNET